MGGARVLVVGGSAGIGRAVGVAAAAAGAQVVFAARRVDRLEAAVAEAGAASYAVPLDVCDEASVRAGVERAVECLGGLDAVVVAAGIAKLGRLADEGTAEWREVLDTNLVGPALVARAAVPHLAATGGVMLFCSSTTDAQPRWGLSSYGVSKAALNRLVDALRSEHRDVRFVRATIGSTAGTEFADDFDPDALGHAFAEWIVAAQHTANVMPLASLAGVVLQLVTTLLAHPDVDIPHVHIEPPGGAYTLPASAAGQRFEGHSGR